jgi:hypothetical protein
MSERALLILSDPSFADYYGLLSLIKCDSVEKKCDGVERVCVHAPPPFSDYSFFRLKWNGHTRSGG